MKYALSVLLAMCFVAGFCACAQPPSVDAEPTTESPSTALAETYAAFPDAPEYFTGMKEAGLQPYFELAQETLGRYILAMKVTGEEPGLPQFPLPMTPLLQKYTQLRFENDRRYMFYGTPSSIETSMGSGWIGDWKIIEGKLLCVPCVDVAFRYPGADFDSGFGMGMQMLIENPARPILVDWFDIDKFSWDRQMREGHYNLPEDADPWAVRQWPVSWSLTDPENWLGRCKLLGAAAEIVS